MKKIIIVTGILLISITVSGQDSTIRINHQDWNCGHSSGRVVTIKNGYATYTLDDKKYRVKYNGNKTVWHQDGIYIIGLKQKQ